MMHRLRSSAAFGASMIFSALTLLMVLLSVKAFPSDHKGYAAPGKLGKHSLAYKEALAAWKQSGAASKGIPGLDGDSCQMLAGKCIFTLLNNRMGSSGGLRHESVYPSYTDFRGFWAWDSWKHAFALAGISPELAKNSIRAMFDYQDSSGMVADCIFTDTSLNNYRDTKPPLAAWAVAEIFHRTSDTAFVREMLPKLLKYHRWWYRNRDHDGNGLCEYGSCDGSIQAARWESGWDNAVRFDSAKMVRNNDHAWSMDQESCDLNAYLFSEKRYLSELATAAGDLPLSVSLYNEARVLGDLIQRMMWDETTGFYYDIRLDTKKHIRVPEPDGWIPLWAGIPGSRQAARIREHILDTSGFNTFVPFPTVAAGNPGFSPEKGYWRGPVWLDQAYFALNGLRQYGYGRDADMLLLKLLRNGEGILDRDKPLRENYNPLNGKGMNAEYFSWSAAHILMMLREAGRH